MPDDGRERAALAGSGDLRLQDRLVLRDRGKSDAPRMTVDDLLDLPEGPLRKRAFRPRDLTQMLLGHVVSEPQRERRHHDGLGGLGRLLHDLDVAQAAALTVEVFLSRKDRERAEGDGEQDHDQSS
jgi:hypothetical protein